MSHINGVSVLAIGMFLMNLLAVPTWATTYPKDYTFTRDNLNQTDALQPESGAVYNVNCKSTGTDKIYKGTPGITWHSGGITAPTPTANSDNTQIAISFMIPGQWTGVIDFKLDGTLKSSGTGGSGSGSTEYVWSLTVGDTRYSLTPHVMYLRRLEQGEDVENPNTNHRIGPVKAVVTANYTNPQWPANTGINLDTASTPELPLETIRAKRVSIPSNAPAGPFQVFPNGTNSATGLTVNEIVLTLTYGTVGDITAKYTPTDQNNPGMYQGTFVPVQISYSGSATGSLSLSFSAPDVQNNLEFYKEENTAHKISTLSWSVSGPFSTTIYARPLNPTNAQTLTLTGQLTGNNIFTDHVCFVVKPTLQILLEELMVVSVLERTTIPQSSYFDDVGKRVVVTYDYATRTGIDDPLAATTNQLLMNWLLDNVMRPSGNPTMNHTTLTGRALEDFINSREYRGIFRIAPKVLMANNQVVGLEENALEIPGSTAFRVPMGLGSLYILGQVYRNRPDENPQPTYSTDANGVTRIHIVRKVWFRIGEDAQIPAEILTIVHDFGPIPWVGVQIEYDAQVKQDGTAKYHYVVHGTQLPTHYVFRNGALQDKQLPSYWEYFFLGPEYSNYPGEPGRVPRTAGQTYHGRTFQVPGPAKTQEPPIWQLNQLNE